MKRANHIFEQLVSDENLRLALIEVNASHRWLPKHRPNKTVAWVEQDMDARVSELREIICQIVYHKRQLSKPKKKQRYDKSAGKWRIINEPKLWPDPVHSPCSDPGPPAYHDARDGSPLLRQHPQERYPLRKEENREVDGYRPKGDEILRGAGHPPLLRQHRH